MSDVTRIDTDLAACSDPSVPAEWFHALPPGRGFKLQAEEETRKALEVCQRCPLRVRMPCLEWGLENEDFGVWGGLTPYERHALGGRGVGRPGRGRLTREVVTAAVLARFPDDAELLEFALARLVPDPSEGAA